MGFLPPVKTTNYHHHNMSIITEIQQCQDEAREGWMPEKKSAPDFGEPWKKSILTGFIETKHGDAAHTAKQFGVCQATVGHIATGKNWNHVWRKYHNV